MNLADYLQECQDYGKITYDEIELVSDGFIITTSDVTYGDFVAELEELDIDHHLVTDISDAEDDSIVKVLITVSHKKQFILSQDQQEYENY